MIQQFVFIIMSLFGAPLIIAHGVFLDCDFTQISRIGVKGFIITTLATFLTLNLLKIALSIKG